MKALDGIDLAIQRGEVHALLGENGAGKSTLVKIMCGIYQPDEGDIFIDGEQRRFNNYRQAIEAGVGIIFQEFSLIPYMSAIDNIFLNREIRNRWGLLDRRAMRRKAEAIFKRLTVAIDLDCPVEQLSVAQQQFVEIAKALSLEARVLVLDEPTATLTPGEAEHLFSVMNDLRLLGVGMVFISHHLDEIFTICDRITVLRDGAYIETLATGDTNVEELVRLMVGRKIENAFPVKQHPVDTATVLLEAEIQRETRRDRPLPPAQGRDPRLRRAGGLRAHRDRLGADRRRPLPPQTRQPRRPTGGAALPGAGAGAGHRPAAGEPQNRRPGAAVLGGAEHHPQPAPPARQDLRQRPEGSRRGAAADPRRGVKTPDAETAVSTLSGGNQQKVVIARWLNNDCNILIFDEPTRGIDVGAKAEIYQLMQQLTQQGISIIMISSELPEIIGVCDRVLVFRGGHIVAELTGDDIESNHIMLHATGSAL